MNRISSIRDLCGGIALPMVCFAGAVVVALLSGCEDRRIASYEIAKEFAVAAPPAGKVNDRTSVAAPTEQPESLGWTALAHWKPKPASAMRRASFAVPMSDGSDADLSISVLGGTAGGVPANINRWRAQLGLPELAPGEIVGTTESIPADRLVFTFVDIAGQSGGAAIRMLAAIAEFEGQTWFFKLTGPDQGVAQEKAAFVAFLRSVKTR
ncbi:MAG: hypothetical protein Q7S40_06985 [Opitutaceae bacterium]|nr:hypothetical protein [Opitutaceae bacterium]